MLSRARFAALVLVGAAAEFADSGVALAHIRKLREMALTEGLSETDLAEEIVSGTSPCGTAGVECDMNGVPCSMCITPLAGRGYDGGKVYYSSTVTPGTVIAPPDYLVRDDCGNHSIASISAATVGYTVVPLTKFNQKKSEAAFPGWTNAWCELNSQKVCVDAVVNRDYLFQAKSLDIPADFAYDFYYCKYNGWLSVETRTMVTKGFDALHNHAVDHCAAQNLTKITATSMALQYMPGMLGPGVPTPEQARYIGAWTCAMGGGDGESSGAGCDMAYCHYTYGEVDPAVGSSKPFCVYDECEGWNPMTGMPVSEYMTLAKHADSAGAK